MPTSTRQTINAMGYDASGVMNPVESASSLARLRTPARLYVYDTLLDSLAEDFKDRPSQSGN
jgi:hypothetical protein